MSNSRLLLSSLVLVTLISRLAPDWTRATLLAALLANLTLGIYSIYIYPTFLSPLRHLPEPKGSTGFPWYHADLIKRTSNGEPYRKWLHSTPNDGLIRYRVLWNEERVLLTSPQALREVLVTKTYDFVKPVKPTQVFQAILGYGLLSVEGEEHQIQRKALMPAFSFRHIKELYPVFWSKAKESLTAITAAQKYETVNGNKQAAPQSAYYWSSHTTLDIIGLAACGYDFNAIKEPDTELLTTYRGLFEEEGPLFFWESIGLHLPVKHIMKLPTRQFNILRAASGRIASFALDLIREKQQNLRSDEENSKDILSIAMASGAFSEKGLVDQMMTFLAAGHETTASSMVWAVYLLAKHQEIQTRLRKEIRENVPSPAGAHSDVTAHLIDNLPYLSAVCNEVLRFHSPVPMTMRVAARDTEIAGQLIPKSTPVIIAAWATNVDSKLWGDDAMTFNPDRWLAKGQAHTGGASSNFANLTFIHGPRSCIGKDFAKSEFACLLAAWIGRFEVSFPGGVVPPPAYEGYVTAKPVDRMPVVFSEVEGW